MENKVYGILEGRVVGIDGGHGGYYEESSLMDKKLYSDKKEAGYALIEYVKSENKNDIDNGLTDEDCLFTLIAENSYKKNYSIWNQEEYSYALVIEYTLITP